MRGVFKVAFHPVPDVERFDTGLRYTDILFGFVTRELFLRLQNWTQLSDAMRWHLIVGATLVLGSWIGFRRSLHRSGYQLKFFNLPLFRFIVDQGMLILYFRIAVLTDVSGKPAPDDLDLATHTTKLVMFVFILYVVWDLLGMWMAEAGMWKTDARRWLAKAGTNEGNGTNKPLYPVVDGSANTDERQKINWIGLLISAIGLMLVVVMWSLADCIKPNLLFLATTAVLLLYRWAKEIRTSCQSPQRI